MVKFGLFGKYLYIRPSPMIVIMTSTTDTGWSITIFTPEFPRKGPLLGFLSVSHHTSELSDSLFSSSPVFVSLSLVRTTVRGWNCLCELAVGTSLSLSKNSPSLSSETSEHVSAYNSKYRLPSRLSYPKAWLQLMEAVQETLRVSRSVVSLLWSFGSKNRGSGAGCLCVTGDTNILHQLAITFEWLLSCTCWQTHSQDDGHVRKGQKSRLSIDTCNRNSDFNHRPTTMC